MVYVIWQLMLILIGVIHGVSSGKPTSLSDVTIQEFPHQCSVRYLGSHYCGCAILSVRKVLTSARCVYGRVVSSISVYYRSAHNENLGTDEPITEYKMHDGFVESGNHTEGTFADDVAVLTVGRDLVLDDRAAAIPVAREEDGRFEGDQCNITGWGTTSETLKRAAVLVLTQEECVNDANGGNTVGADVHLCVKSLSTAACNADFGGPVTCFSSRIQGPILAGVISWGSDFCNAEYPLVTARVSHYQSWIENL